MSRGCLPALVLAIVAMVAIVACAGTSDASNAGPRTCKKDLDCGDHQYCTAASVCRTDCFKDTDCIGPYKDSQCNAQGRCIDPVDATPPPADVPADTDKGEATEAGEGGK